MIDALRLFALNLGVAGVGAATLVAVGLPRRRPWWPTIAGLAPLTGLAVCGLCATAGAMAGIDVGLPSLAVLATLVVAAIALAARGRGSVGPLMPQHSGLAGRAVEAVCLGLLAVLAFETVGLAVATPLDQWDGWAIWGAKAHALYAGGDVWSPVFTEPEYVMQHQEYPVLLPALEALSAEALGRFDPVLVDVEAAVVVIAFGAAAWGALRLVLHPAIAALTALALAGAAPLAGNAGANYADAVVAPFTALGLLALLLWLTHDGTAWLVLAALFLGAAALTKSEGVLFALAAIVAAALLARSLGRSLAVVGVFAAGCLAPAALWAIVDRLNGPGADNVDAGLLFDPGRAADAAGRIPTAAETLLAELWSAWPLAAVAVLLALLVATLARAWAAGLFVALWLVLSFGALVLVYFLSVNPIGWHLTTSANRVVFSLALGGATVAPLLVAVAWEASRLPSWPTRSST